MLSKTKEICGVFHLFKIEGEIIFYLSKKGGIVSYLIENESIIWSFQGTKYYNILIYEQLIFLDDANGLIKVLNKENGSLQNEFQNFGISCEIIIDNWILLYSGLNTISFDYDKLSVKWNLPIRLLQFDVIYGHNHIYARKYLEESLIFAIDSKTGKYLFQTDLSQYDKIIQLLGLTNNLLWIITQREENYWFYFDLIAVNAQTGEVEKQIKNNFFFGYTAQLVEEKQSIISLRGNFREDRGTHFLELNTITGEVQRYQKLDKLQDIGLSIFEFSFHENYIYFTASSINDPIFAKSIGVLDYKTLELVWYENLDLQNGAFFASGQKPVVADNKMYLLDTDGTLHIFEKESPPQA